MRLRMGQRVVRHQRGNVGQLGLLRTSEICAARACCRRGRAPRWWCPRAARHLPRGRILPPAISTSRSRIIFRRARLQRQARDAGDRRQRLAAKTQGRGSQQVVRACAAWRWRGARRPAARRRAPCRCPSSTMRISLRPPPSTSMRMRVAPASSEFSSSSFTTDAGRSTTSPAAIWLATWSESMRMRPMHRLYCCPVSVDVKSQSRTICFSALSFWL